MSIPAVTLVCAEAQTYTGSADLVFTHPYGPLPKQLHGVPTIINLALPHPYEALRIAQARSWLGVSALARLSSWSVRGWNTVFAANLPWRRVDLADLTADMLPPPGGWFPEALCRRLFRVYREALPSDALVWDGFMGRGTVGKVAQEFGYRFYGMDNDSGRVALAKHYLGVPG